MAYWLWVCSPSCTGSGALAHACTSRTRACIVTAMRDQVSWGFYIGNFTFLVGVAAAAVVLVIPAYVYDWKPISEIVIFGELLAVSAIVMCLLFVMVDIGRPDRSGTSFRRRAPQLPALAPGLGCAGAQHLSGGQPLQFLSFTISITSGSRTRISPRRSCSSRSRRDPIHTVTAFLYNGLGARPFWNSSILAPRFLASAFCSGPAFMILILFLVRQSPSSRSRTRPSGRSPN